MSDWIYSNFNKFEIPMQYGELVFYTVENFYQAMKTLDQRTRKMISNMSPAIAKKAGRNVTIRSDWDQIKEQVMMYALRWKMFPNGKLTAIGHQLIDHVGPIVEENYWHDNYWGRCSCFRCGSGKIGKNRLGVLLMELRAELINIVD